MTTAVQLPGLLTPGELAVLRDEAFRARSDAYLHQRDDYELSVPGFQGSAKLALAEFRKSKIKLAITGKRDGASCHPCARRLM